MSEEKEEKYKREIEEILARMGEPRRREGAWYRWERRGQRWLAEVRHALWGAGLEVSPQRLLTLALVLIVVAYFSRGILLRGAAYLALLALALFLTALIFSVAGWHQPRHEKRWRGQPLDYSSRAWPDWRRLWAQVCYHLHRWWKGPR